MKTPLMFSKDPSSVSYRFITIVALACYFWGFAVSVIVSHL